MVRDEYLQVEGVHLQTRNVQALECKVSTQNWEGSIVLAYRSPSAEQVENEELNTWIHSVHRDAKGLVLMGDFNMPGIDWDRESSRPDETGENFLRLVTE